jgi:hypothetical protein
LQPLGQCIAYISFPKSSVPSGACIADGWFYPHKYMCLEHIQI